MQERKVTPEAAERRDADGVVVALRRLARAVKHAPDRVLHPLRRRSLRRRLRRRGLPRSIVFICTGNICRSPYAAHRFASTLPEALRSYMTVGSAGFIGPDRGTPNSGLAAASARGLDLREHRSHVINAEIARSVDLLVVMEAAQAARLRTSLHVSPGRIVVLGDLDPDPIDTRTVRDPIFQPLHVFEETYERIDRCIGELYRAIVDHEPLEGITSSDTPTPPTMRDDDDRDPGARSGGVHRSRVNDSVASVRH